MKTLLGMVTFGNLPFTKMAIAEIRATTNWPVDFFVVIGNPDDHETEPWLESLRDCDGGAMMGVRMLKHGRNWGFPSSINDIYDCAFIENDFDNLILCGNDVIPYPGAIDAMIECAREVDYEWICASEYNSAALVRDHPEAARYFTGSNLSFTDFTARPWEIHPIPTERIVEHDCIKDVRNLCLFKRSVFEKIGYADAGFWPGGYFEDNDYCTRARLAGVKACGLRHASYFHFWSRTIHQGPKGAEHHAQFQANERWYRTKWGGRFGDEIWAVPFDGRAHQLCEGALIPGALKIGSRANEEAVVNHWSGLWA